MALVVFKLILLPIRVSGISMFPTYKDRSINFVNRLAYVRHKPRRGDVVGIRVAGSDTPGRAPGLMFMKRVVGLPGEIISFSRGHLFVDGAMLDEPYVNGPCNWNALPVQIGSNQYYAVGDNRSMPIEFHDHGRVDRARIVGKVLF
jgi:signal peptidase I